MLRKLFRVLSLLVVLSYSCPAQDTIYWERRDTATFDSLYNGAESIEGFFTDLTGYLTARRSKGPITRSLAYYYHWIPLRLKGYLPRRVLPYADTAIILRTLVGDEKANVAQSHYERGRVLQRIGRYRESYVSHERAVRLMSDAILEQDTTVDLANRQGYFLKELAVATRAVGNYYQAHLWLNDIPPLLRIAPNPITELEMLLARADIYNEAGQRSRSVAQYEAVIAHPHYPVIPSPDRGVVLLNYSVLLNEMGRPQEAYRNLELAEALLENDPYALNRASLYTEMLRCAAMGVEITSAPELLDNGMRATRNAYPDGVGPQVGELLLNAAIVAHNGGTHERADSLFRAAGRAVGLRTGTDGVSPLSVGAGVPDWKVALKVLAARQQAYGDTEADLDAKISLGRTIDTLLTAAKNDLVSITTLGQAINRQSYHYSTALNLMLKRYRVTGSVDQLSEAYRFVADQKSNLLRRFSAAPGLAEALGVDSLMVQRRSRIEVALHNAEQALAINAKQLSADSVRGQVLTLTGDLRALVDSIALLYPQYVSAVANPGSFDPIDAAENLPGDQLVVEYHLTADSIYTFTLQQTTGLRIYTVARPSDLERMTERILDHTDAARDAYDLLLKQAVTGATSFSRMKIIPHDLLSAVPFAAMRDETGVVIRKYAVSYVYAAGFLFDPPAATDRFINRYEGYGISYRDILRNLGAATDRTSDRLREIGPLLHADREVIDAAEIMNGISYTDDQATKRKFLANAGNSRVLHLSMHGVRGINPLESAVIFHNGEQTPDLLTMREVLGQRIPAELTVLSACHTGGGPLQNSEGLISIARAFTAAGSQATLSSTWETNDAATHYIVTEFYRALANGKPKDVALQSAVVHFLDGGTETDRNPRNWANLNLYGSVEPLSQPPSWWLSKSALLSILAAVSLLAAAILYFRQPQA